MDEIIFVIEEDIEEGYTARALNYSIFTDGATLQDLKNNINDAVHCHFVEQEMPKIVRMHFVRDEVFAL
ncbi:MAG TPA: 2-oxoisovalerate dehydrogenase [Candidatus Kapabacteria bacterium]|jgi:hypothetical protein|nr:2-oxoisovalerate dehydrogenase [Candidatus Kapabacteria bacterium]